MYFLIALLSGVALSVMISINGSLAGVFGTFPAAAVIHLVGSVAALFPYLLQKEKKPLWGHRPAWLYLGGVIGVLTTVCQNYAFGRISVTSIVALGLLGQTCMSLAVDRFGLLGMQKQPAKKASPAGVAIVFVGVALMLDQSVTAAIIAVCLAFGSGISVVVSRTINARLAERAGALGGSLVNHLAGLPVTLALAFAVTRGAPFSLATGVASRPWMYLGGVLGVLVVLLCNLAVPKVSAFRMTLLGFVGQVFTGILLDILIGGGYTRTSFIGGVIVALGIAANLLSERINARREQKRLAYYARIREIETAHRDAMLERQRKKAEQ